VSVLTHPPFPLWWFARPDARGSAEPIQDPLPLCLDDGYMTLLKLGVRIRLPHVSKARLALADDSPARTVFMAHKPMATWLTGVADPLDQRDCPEQVIQRSKHPLAP
jgi:hypothetical protein